jgi:hypothetical protein
MPPECRYDRRGIGRVPSVAMSVFRNCTTRRDARLPEGKRGRKVSETRPKGPRHLRPDSRALASSHEGLKMQGVKATVRLSPDLDEEPGIVELRGWLAGSEVEIDGCRIRVTFCDPVRLVQNVESEIGAQGYYCDGAIVVVRSVTRSSIDGAMAAIARHGWEELLPA